MYKLTMRTRSSNRNLLRVKHQFLTRPSAAKLSITSVTRFSRFHVHRHVSHGKHPELCLSFSLLLQSAAENVQPSFIHAAQVSVFALKIWDCRPARAPMLTL